MSGAALRQLTVTRKARMCCVSEHPADTRTSTRVGKVEFGSLRVPRPSAPSAASSATPFLSGEKKHACGGMETAGPETARRRVF